MSATLMGSFSALTYAFNAFGGIVADRILGIKRTMFLGAFFLAAGYICLALFSSVHPDYIYFSLALIIIGSCLFKPAPTNLIGEIYAGDAHMLDITYTYYYMSINIGSFAASAMIPSLAKNYGYGIALLTCGAGVITGILYNLKNYDAYRYIDNKVGNARLNKKQSFLMLLILLAGFFCLTIAVRYDYLTNCLLGIACISIFGYFIYQIINENEISQKNKMLVVLVLMFYALVFFIVYQQKNTSFMLFNKDHVNLLVWGVHINPQTVAGLLDTTGVILLTPLFAYVYRLMGKKDFSLPRKFSLGLFLSSCTYGILWIVCVFTNPSAKISLGWEILAFTFFFAASELLISALGLSLMAQLVPERLRGFAMGMWFLVGALGLKIGSFIASIAASQKITRHVELLRGGAKITSFHNYQHLFGSVFLYSMAVAVGTWLIDGHLTRMIKAI